MAIDPNLVSYILLALVYVVVLNVVVFLLYGFDKQAAQNHTLRISEKTFHLLTLGGGTIGAILGQRYFRHKTRKRSFQDVFRAIVILQAIGLVGALFYLPIAFAPELRIKQNFFDQPVRSNFDPTSTLVKDIASLVQEDSLKFF
jgi:uncharacterized membrane protein YsdA (DUF1294 family)